jgi:hypothetical protein
MGDQVFKLVTTLDKDEQFRILSEYSSTGVVPQISSAINRKTNQNNSEDKIDIAVVQTSQTHVQTDVIFGWATKRNRKKQQLESVGFTEQSAADWIDSHTTKQALLKMTDVPIIRDSLHCDDSSVNASCTTGTVNCSSSSPSNSLTTVVLDSYNGTYHGQVNADGQRHGQGRYMYKARNKGSVYEGAYRHDQREGFGVMRFKCAASDTIVTNVGGMYTGHWADDKKHGQGRCEYDNGDVYEGEWRRGLKYGQGRMVRADGTVVEGLWWRGNLKKDKKKGK